jgi:hypothetical protein
MLAVSVLHIVLSAGCATDADCMVSTWKCCACDVQRAMTPDDLKAEQEGCAKKECKKPNCEAIKPFDPDVLAVCKAGKCALEKPPPTCKVDADCTVSTWKCCACPEQRALSRKELKAEEDACAVKKCAAPECPDTGQPFEANVTAACKAGKCFLQSKPPPPPPKAECSAAADCVVWCCPQDLAAAPRGGKKPQSSCKRCPSPAPAAECLEGRCTVAPHAMGK